MQSRPSPLEADVTETLVSAERIARRVHEMAGEICRDYPADAAHAKGLVLVPVLTGAFMFLADLVRHLPQKIRIEVVTVSSYPGASTVSKGAALVGVLPQDLEGRDVLVIDDILDSGQTLGLLHDEIVKRGPRSVRTCVFLRKSCRRVREVHCDYVGFDIPDAFVVGYGLDHDGFYRNLPYVGVLKATEGARTDGIGGTA
ncbi:MAG: hypoxanthine phosphoribosyltransferase [Phycisphaerae bacterium]|nr:hypoxanthine phosphoribosyltransferase [Phycisphaerae bacterium]